LFPKVELDGFAQSTWNCQSRRTKPSLPSVGGMVDASSTSANRFGEPAGGSVEPSRSPGSWPMYWPPVGLAADSSK